MRVLLIDDHEVVRRGLRMVLEDAFGGIEFGEAATSATALEALARGNWDLILLDINIPGRSGLELLTDVRRLCPRTPVLILSAFPEEDYAVRALRGGAAGYLTKHSAADELVLAVRKVLEGGQYVTVSLAERLAASLRAGFTTQPHEILSERELQVLRLTALGHSLKEVAAALALSEKTVATYRARIGEKTGLTSSVEIARYALKHGLVD